ncbi:MAG TPA: phage minor head protein, partial [Holophaga sp.]|nr:phage minor head protein [Holophaga sp.]
MPIELKLQPPQEAVEAFGARGLLVTSSWQSLWQEEHARAFTVANLARLDLLQDVHSAVDQAIKEGQDYRTFAKGLVPKLQAAGWWNQPVSEGKPLTPSRLQLIYDANLRVSYSASQWQRIQTLKKRKPYLFYSTMKDARVRPLHREWEGICLPVDHPWWKTHFPPNGWRCRCMVMQ